MPAGRPSDYTKWKARAICIRLASGESLRSICDRGLYPSRFAVLRWLEANEEFRNHYAQAREMQAEHYLDEIIEISDDSILDRADDQEGNEKINHEVIQRSRLRVDTRKWVMERMAAKKYGKKTEVVNHHSFDNLSDEQLEQRIKSLQDELKN